MSATDAIVPADEAGSGQPAPVQSATATADDGRGGDGASPDPPADDPVADPTATSTSAATPDPTTAAAPAPAFAAPTAVAGAAATSATVSTLAAAIVTRANQATTRFDVVLEPAGLGRVSVRLEIAANGRLSAALTFEKSASASALGARAQELHAALAKAGFDVGADALSFEARAPSTALASNGGGGASTPDGSPFEQSSPRPSRAAAFAEAAFDDLPAPVAYGAPPSGGYDIRV